MSQVDRAAAVRQACITMPAKATVRELRNNFPSVKKLVEREGEVVVTDRGVPRYRLLPFVPRPAVPAPPAKDYLARLRRHQPRPLGARAARALDEANRGPR